MTAEMYASIGFLIVVFVLLIIASFILASKTSKSAENAAYIEQTLNFVNLVEKTLLDWENAKLTNLAQCDRIKIATYRNQALRYLEKLRPYNSIAVMYRISLEDKLYRMLEETQTVLKDKGE